MVFCVFLLFLSYALPQEFVYDTALQWSVPRKNTLGPTGKRIFTDHIRNGLGFQGKFIYGSDDLVFQDPVIITVHDPDEKIDLNMEKIFWRPSHLEILWRHGHITIQERKFITDDDMMADCVTIKNGSRNVQTLRIQISSKTADQLDRSLSKITPIELNRALPEMEPALCEFHLAFQKTEKPISIVFMFSNGASEEVIVKDDTINHLNGRAIRHSLDGSMDRLSYTPPPGCLVKEVKAADIKSAYLEVLPKTGRLPVLTGRPEFLGAPLHLSLAGDRFMPLPTNTLFRNITLDPKESVVFTVVLATGLNSFSTSMKAMGASEDRRLFEKHLKFYRSWFDQNAPEFKCSDPVLERAWLYRWFLVRHRLVRPGTPGFTLPVFYPGRPTHLTLTSTSHILMETRWLRDRFFAQGQIRALLMGLDDDKGLQSMGIHKKHGPQKHWIPAAAVGAFEVNGALQYLKETLPFLKKSFELDFTWPSEGETIAYRFASAMALYRGFAAMGDEGPASRLKGEAERIRKTAMDVSLDQKTRAFFLFAELCPAPFTPFQSNTYLQSIQAEAIANGMRYHNESHDLLSFLKAYALQHFQDGDLNQPMLYENKCPDFLNSSFNDLLVRFVGGLVPSTTNELELWPLVKELDHFRFTCLPYHGYLLDISWDKPDGNRINPEIPEGYVLYVNNKEVVRKKKLERVAKIKL